MKDNYLVQAWLVVGLALCFGAALAGVDAALSEKIAANKLDETMRQIPSLVPESTGGEEVEIGGRTVYRATAADGEQLGWIVPAAGPGFADKIEVLIGLDPWAETITGLYVLSQKETPGLGNKITDPEWLKQFAGKATSTPLSVGKGEPPKKPETLSVTAASWSHTVTSVTGATISSRSVTAIVNAAVAEMRPHLAAAVK